MAEFFFSHRLLIKARNTTLLLIMMVVTGCASDGQNNVRLEEPVAAIELALEAEQELDQPELPGVDLTEELLEQLMVVSFAPYVGELGLSAEQAMNAAVLSKDHRLASFAAVTALRIENFDLAVSAANLWLELVPDENAASTTLILAQLGLGNPDAAYAELKKRDGDLPVDEQVENSARLLAGQRNQESAMTVATRYIEEFPDSPDALLSGAYVADRFQDDEQATDWLKRALVLKPGWDRAAQLKANVLRRQGKTEERAKFIADFLAENPESVSMRINHAAELARAEKYAEAFSLMQQVVDDDPRNVSALSYVAALAEHQKDLDSAKSYYRRVIRLEPDNDEVNWTLARYAVQEKDYKRAEGYYQDIIGERLYFRAQLQVANMRYHTRGLKEAINVLRVLEPRTEDEYIDRATTRHYLLMQEHQYEEAFAAINETLTYLPDNFDLRYARSLVAAELEEVETVESDLRFVIAQQPDNADALNALGYTLADQTGRLEEAKELIEKALELRPDAAHIIDSMGWVLYRLGELEEAESYLRQAYEKAPQAEIAAHLGEVLWEQEKFDAAKAIWREGWADDKDNPALVSTLERYGVNLEEEVANLSS